MRIRPKPTGAISSRASVPERASRCKEVEVPYAAESRVNMIVNPGTLCSCAFREIDFGGCRCQAMAITGDARNTDPACALSPYHGEMVRLAREEAAKPAPAFVYRNPRNAAEAAKTERPLVPAE